MTENEFKLICIVFCKKYEGKTFGEVLQGVYYDIKNIKIEFENMHISKSINMYEKGNFYICLLGGKENLMYLTQNNSVVKIPNHILKFEDMV